MGRVLAGMQRPAFVFDGRNIVDAARLSQLGFEVHSIGRP
jgi:UDPglucose 6-dehydrogenase